MEIEPSLFRVKVAAPPMAVFSADTTLPMVWPAVVVMLALLPMSPSGPFSATVMVSPAANPLESDAESPVAVSDGIWD